MWASIADDFLAYCYEKARHRTFAPATILCYLNTPWKFQILCYFVWACKGLDKSLDQFISHSGEECLN